MNGKTKVTFERIDTGNVSPKKYLKDFLTNIKPDSIKSTTQGDFETFSLSGRTNVSFGFVGQEPEKFDVVDTEVTVEMPRCVLFYHYFSVDVPGKLPVPHVEIVNAL